MEQSEQGSQEKAAAVDRAEDGEVDQRKRLPGDEVKDIAECLGAHAVRRKRRPEKSPAEFAAPDRSSSRPRIPARLSRRRVSCLRLATVVAADAATAGAERRDDVLVSPAARVTGAIAG